jgi:ferredoxin, 2Fe-2S
MARITYIEDAGKAREIEVPSGWSLMEGAVKNNVPGIDADCGGACACGTCHVYIEPEWVDRLPAMQDMENEMIEFANELRPNSRLSCQIVVNDALNGLVVRTPRRQR